MDVSILIVSWNVRDLLRQCLLSLSRDQNSRAASAIQSDVPETDRGLLNTEIIVVDNASTDDTVEMMRAIFPKVHVIANSENGGFARG
ncbi:MAG TPA: glycosyltransferase, partial [Anaerolineae bacterium]